MTHFDGPTNMSLDRALLEAAEGEGRVGWRVYGWDGPWLTMGMNQDPAADLLPTNPVPWVMRPTGGNAVLHGHDVTVGFAAPLSAIWAGDSENSEGRVRSVRGAYRWVTRPIIEALCACGLPCELAENVAGVVTARVDFSDSGATDFLAKAQSRKGPQRGAPSSDLRPQTSDLLPAISGLRPRTSDLGPTMTNDLPNPSRPVGISTALRQSAIRNPKSADCFLGVSRNDVVDLRTGLKVCGCAFRMTKRAVLLQASIPAGAPLIDPALIFAEPSTIVAPDWGAGRFPEAFEQALTQLLEASTVGPVGQVG